MIRLMSLGQVYTSNDGLISSSQDPAELALTPHACRLTRTRHSQLPKNLEQYPSEKIVQGYLSIDANGAQVRLRKVGERYFETYKSSGRLQRTELEIELGYDQFSTLWPGTENRRLEKIRYQISEAGQKIELKVFRGNLEGLVLAEIEFPSRQKSREFEPPNWLGEEVTEDSRYKNQNLAQKRRSARRGHAAAVTTAGSSLSFFGGSSTSDRQTCQ
jgi:adenylate cyclase